ncbi:amino acid ABC transporter permease [Ancylobacter sp. Lp-2]|uniref:amino acid ABC transporter permease n=1 Tax=Ancylobacter sp. Lp-2 TaxID=2881339 RepID=UPI001E6164D7|nr:amino acid ABC transporter permease [Ancylobacter sp. Lp-2]MCB4767868.1 amino acid ABC transporter permease [Ancylobacter sp. Lp-2]
MKPDLAIFLDALPRLVEASLINLRIAAITCLLTLVVGAGVTVIRAQKWRLVNAVLELLISFLRGTPLLIQIFLFYYGLPILGLRLDPVTAGVLAITCNTSAFLTESLRGTLLTIEEGHVEAAVAIGLPPHRIWTAIVLPQLLRRAVPVMVNEGTVIVKSTALLSMITVVEVLRTAQQMGAASFRPIEPILGAALCFIVINLGLMAIGAVVERRFVRGRI